MQGQEELFDPDDIEVIGVGGPPALTGDEEPEEKVAEE